MMPAMLIILMPYCVSHLFVISLNLWKRFSNRKCNFPSIRVYVNKPRNDSD